MPSQGMTVVKWGDELILYNVHSTRFSQELVRDDAGINPIGTKFIYSGVGYCHNYDAFEQPHIDPVTSSSMDAAEIQRTARSLSISKQRERLQVLIGAGDDGSGGTVLLEANPFVKGTRFANLSRFDVANGPWCTNLEVQQINAKLMRVEFTFECTLAECDPDGGNRNNSAILSNTWSCEDELNQNFMLTRKWTGQIHLATALLNPHSFRNWCLPVLQDGMYRDSMTFRASDDGLVLHYSITDKEGYFSPPPPATKWSSPLRATYTTGTGKMTYIEASVGLEGDRYADKRLLLSLAINLVESKILALDGALFQNGVPIVSTIEQFAVSEEISADTSSVHVTGVAMRPVVGKDYNVLLDDAFGKDPKKLVEQGVNRQGANDVLLQWDTKAFRGAWPVPPTGPNGPYGDQLETEGAVSAVTALSTHLQTPCDTDHNVKDGEEAGGVKSIRRKATKIKAYKAGDLKPVAPFTTHVNRTHLSNMYTSYEMQSRYENKQNTVQMPIARFSTTSPSSARQPSSAFIALSPPQTRRIIRCRVKRIGREPEIPVAKSFTDAETGIRFHHLFSNDMPATPDYRPGGTTEHFREMEIVYGLDRQPEPGESLPVGFNPFDVLGLVRASLPKSTGFDEGPALV